MSAACTIRLYRETDLPQCVELVRELQIHEAPWNDRAKHPDEIGPWYMQQIKDWCGENEGVILVAEIGNMLAGYAAVGANCLEDGKSDEVAFSYAHVSDLVVTGSARRQGIGRALLSACEMIARDRGREELRIGVLAANEVARQAYLGFGFEEHLLTLRKKLV